MPSQSVSSRILMGFGNQTSMTPSSLKKMRGSRRRKEGIYASTNSNPSLGSCLNSDLGLTLLPVSQTQKEGDKSEQKASYRLQTSVDGLPESGWQTTQSEICELPWLGSSSANNIRSNGKIEDKDRRQDDCRFFRHGKRRKLDNVHPCQSPNFGSGKATTTVNASKTKTLGASIGSSHEIHRAKKKYQADEVSLDNNEEAETVSKDSRSGGSNVFEFGLFPEDPNEVSSSQPTSGTWHTSRYSPASMHNADITVSGATSPRRGISISASVLKQPGEPRKSGPSDAVVQSRSSPTVLNPPQQRSGNRRKLNSSWGDHQPVSRSSVRVLRSWTSHFPKVSRKSEAKPYAKRLDNSSTILLFSPTFLCQHACSMNCHYTTVGSHHLPTSTQKQSLSSQKDICSPLKASAFSSDDYTFEASLHFASKENQQSRIHRRATSLPNLASRYQIPTMNLICSEHLTALPTPPLESRHLSPHRRPSDPYFNAAADALRGMPLVNGPSSREPNVPASASHLTHYTAPSYGDHPTFLGSPYSGPQDMSYPTGDVQHQRIAGCYQVARMSSNISACSNNIRTPPREQFRSRAAHDNPIIPTLQQHNGQMLQEGPSHGHTDVKVFDTEGAASSSGWQQPWQPQQWIDEAESHLRKYKTDIRALQDQIAQDGRKRRELEQSLEEAQQRCNALVERTRFHETGEAAQRLHTLEFANMRLQQQTVALTHENSKLRRNNARLCSEMERLVTKPRSDVLLAKNILQNLESTAASGQRLEVNNNQDTSPTSTVCGSRQLQSPTVPNPKLHEQVSPTVAFGQADMAVLHLANGHSESEAAACIINSLSTHIPKCPSSPMTHPHLQGGSSNSHAGNMANMSPEKVTIDLTHDLSLFSDTCTAAAPHVQETYIQVQPSPAETPQDMQAHGNFTTQFSKKDLNWLEGNHPGRVGSEYSTNFGSSSSRKVPAIKPAKTGDLPSKTKCVSNAEAPQTGTNKEQTRQHDIERKRAKQAAYSKKHREKKKKANEQSQRALSRKSTDTQKHRKQNRQSPGQAQRQVTQNTLDERLYKEGPDDEHVAHVPHEEPPSSMELDSLFEDDMDSGPGSHTKDSYEGQDTEDTNNGYEDHEFAKRLEAALAAETEAEVKRSSNGAVAIESGVGDATSAIVDPPDGAGYQGTSESEESEEE